LIFSIGDSKNINIYKLQIQLRTLKPKQYNTGIVDGIFGKHTKQAVIQFQKDNGLNADGIVGLETWSKLFSYNEIPKKPKLFIPESRNQLRELFGNPLIIGYWKSYGGFCTTPLSLNHCFPYQWKGSNGFWCNKFLIPKFKNVYAKIVRNKLQSKLVSFDGCYALRNTRGKNRLSMHSWGIAMDHNAKTNRLGIVGDMDLGIVKAFKSEGFFWGGDFRRPDPMHFEYTRYGL